MLGSRLQGVILPSKQERLWGQPTAEKRPVPSTFPQRWAPGALPAPQGPRKASSAVSQRTLHVRRDLEPPCIYTFFSALQSALLFPPIVDFTDA